MNLYILYRRMILNTSLRGSIELVPFAKLMEMMTGNKVKSTQYWIFIFGPNVKDVDKIKHFVKQYQKKSFLSKMIFNIKAKNSYPEIKF